MRVGPGSPVAGTPLPHYPAQRAGPASASALACPRGFLGANWFKHIYRELNDRADDLSKQARMGNCSITSIALVPSSSALKGAWDGSAKDGSASSAWWLQAYDTQAELWIDVASGRKKGTSENGSALKAELEGAYNLLIAAAIYSLGITVFKSQRLTMLTDNNYKLLLGAADGSFSGCDGKYVGALIQLCDSYFWNKDLKILYRF